MIIRDTLLTRERLIIHRFSVGHLYTLLWSGECDFRNPTEALSPTLNALLSELRECKLVLDFRDLIFMNSSSIPPVLALVKGACSKGIPVHLIFNANLSWQRITTLSMRALERTLKPLTIELQGREDTPR